MRCDMVVAVGPATVEGQTLFGHNCAVPSPEPVTLVRTRGREYSVGEVVRTPFLELPQARQTYTVVAAQPRGCWGYVHGYNEHGLAVGFVPLGTRLERADSGLLGTDFVRLALERCRSAQQALDLLTDLLPNHGRSEGALSVLGKHDPAFLLADPGEAFALESAGGYWVEQEVCEVRAVSEVRVIRQDWDRIAPGFAELAIKHGWWPQDGSKLDFAGCLNESNPGLASGWRRWGRATLLLEQQNGHIDPAYLRRVLGDHYECTLAELDPRRAGGQVPLCQHAPGAGWEETAASFLAALSAPAERVGLAWWTLGPPCSSIWFPILLEGELPAALTSSDPESVVRRLDRLPQYLQDVPQEQASVHEELARLQGRLDQDAEDFCTEGAELKARGDRADLARLASLFMQHAIERVEAAAAILLPDRLSVAAASW